MKDLKQMLGKKKELDPAKKESKLGVLKDLKSTMSNMMGEDMKGKMMKATVAAKNPEDLKAGLEKAKDVVEELPEEMQSSDESEHEEYSDELLEKCDSPEEIDDLIAKLQEKKQEMLKG